MHVHQSALPPQTPLPPPVQLPPPGLLAGRDAGRPVVDAARGSRLTGLCLPAVAGWRVLVVPDGALAAARVSPLLPPPPGNLTGALLTTPHAAGAAAGMRT